MKPQTDRVGLRVTPRLRRLIWADAKRRGIRPSDVIRIVLSLNYGLLSRNDKNAAYALQASHGD